MAKVTPMALLDVNGLEIPPEIFTLDGFRSWFAALGEDAPRATFAGGYVYVEMSPQNYRTHGPLVSAINSVLTALAAEDELGMYHTPPSWFTHPACGISTEPDGFLTRYASLESGRIGINPERASEMVGAPDMVLEVVSASSQRKDREELRRRYALAGIEEYWLVDAQSAALEFQILRLERGAYVASGDDAGWLASETWDRDFRLRRITNRVGLSEFRLDQRPRA